jgi:thioredoxin 1
MNYFYSNEENALTDNKAIICFSAKWCTPCKKIKPLFEDLAKKNKDINFYEVDIENNEDFITQFNITSVPTFILLKKGNKITELVGGDINNLTLLIMNLL